MSKARIRRVRAERDALNAENAKLRAALGRESSRRQEVRDLVGWYAPDREDPTQFRDALWEAITGE